MISVNSLRPRQNGRYNADDIFKCIFLNENVWIPIKISLKFVPKVPINNIPALVQILAWRRSGDKPLSEPMVVRLLTHICVTRPQWVKSSPLSAAYMHQRTGSSLLQIMDWLVAWLVPSHYLNQCWNIVNQTLRNKLLWKSIPNTKLFIHENTFENVICEMAAILFRGRWFKLCLQKRPHHYLIWADKKAGLLNVIALYPPTNIPVYIFLLARFFFSICDALIYILQNINIKICTFRSILYNTEEIYSRLTTVCLYCRLEIYLGYIWYDNVHRIMMRMIKLRSGLHSRTTPHTSPLRASYGVSFASYTQKNDREISRAHCLMFRKISVKTLQLRGCDSNWLFIHLFCVKGFKVKSRPVHFDMVYFSNIIVSSDLILRGIHWYYMYLVMLIWFVHSCYIRGCGNYRPLVTID